MKQVPTFSIVVPLFNKRETIRRALNSILDQTLQDFEIVVVNDGSSDGGEAEVAAMRDSRVRLIHQSNGGVSAARNRGIQEARAEIIALLDADDEWKPEFLATIDSMVQRFPQCAVYATGYEFVNSAGRARANLVRGLDSDKGSAVMTDYFEVAAVSDPPICSSAVAVRKSAFAVIGGFPVRAVTGEDLLSWARLAARFDVAYDRGSFARIHYPESAHLRRERCLVDDAFIGDELQKLEVRREQRASWQKYIGMWYSMRASSMLELGRRKPALRNSIKALHFGGWSMKTGYFCCLALLPSPFSRRIYAASKAYWQRVPQLR